MELKDDNRNWIYDEAQIRTYAMSSFKRLYTKDKDLHKSYPIVGDFPTVDA